MTGHGSDVKHFFANTVLDATNRSDQDICPPMTFAIMEMTDMSDPLHPRPMTALTEEIEVDDDADERFVTVLGHKIMVKDLKNEMSTLTNLSNKHCKNNQKASYKHKHKLWQEGRLDAWWLGKIISPDDVDSFNQYQRYENERFRAPILLAAMINLVQKYAPFKIQFFFHFAGETEATRFFRQKLHHLNYISPTMRRHPEFKSLFKQASSIQELLGTHQVNHNKIATNSEI